MAWLARLFVLVLKETASAESNDWYNPFNDQAWYAYTALTHQLDVWENWTECDTKTMVVLHNASKTVLLGLGAGAKWSWGLSRLKASIEELKSEAITGTSGQESGTPGQKTSTLGEGSGNTGQESNASGEGPGAPSGTPGQPPPEKVSGTSVPTAKVNDEAGQGSSNIGQESSSPHTSAVRCRVCSKKGVTLFSCSGCHSEKEMYCSKECQIAAWPKHKLGCPDSGRQPPKTSAPGQESGTPDQGSGASSQEFGTSGQESGTPGQKTSTLGEGSDNTGQESNASGEGPGAPSGTPGQPPPDKVSGTSVPTAKVSDEATAKGGHLRGGMASKLLGENLAAQSNIYAALALEEEEEEFPGKKGEDPSAPTSNVGDTTTANESEGVPAKKGEDPNAPTFNVGDTTSANESEGVRASAANAADEAPATGTTASPPSMSQRVAGDEEDQVALGRDNKFSLPDWKPLENLPLPDTSPGHIMAATAFIKACDVAIAGTTDREGSQLLQKYRGTAVIWVARRLDLLKNPQGLPPPDENDMQTDKVEPYAKALHAVTLLVQAEQHESEDQDITYQRMLLTAKQATILRETENQLSYGNRVELEPSIVKAFAHATGLQGQFEKALSLARKAVEEADLVDGFSVVVYGTKLTTEDEEILQMAVDAGQKMQEVWRRDDVSKALRGSKLKSALWQTSNNARANKRYPPGPNATKMLAAPASPGHEPKASTATGNGK